MRRRIEAKTDGQMRIAIFGALLALIFASEAQAQVGANENGGRPGYLGQPSERFRSPWLFRRLVRQAGCEQSGFLSALSDNHTRLLPTELQY
jgi:hypothetical protein